MGRVKSCCQNIVTAMKRKKGIAFYFLESCLVFIAVRCNNFSYLIEVKITAFCDNSVICWKALGILNTLQIYYVREMKAGRKSFIQVYGKDGDKATEWYAQILG